MLHTIKKSYSIKLFYSYYHCKNKKYYSYKNINCIVFSYGAQTKKRKECVLTYNETTS